MGDSTGVFEAHLISQELRDSALKVGANISMVAWPPLFSGSFFKLFSFSIFPHFLGLRETVSFPRRPVIGIYDRWSRGLPLSRTRSPTVILESPGLIKAIYEFRKLEVPAPHGPCGQLRNMAWEWFRYVKIPVIFFFTFIFSTISQISQS